MMHGDLMRMQSLGTALNLETFWNWLHEHHNCIVRAGTSEAWLYIGRWGIRKVLPGRSTAWGMWPTAKETTRQHAISTSKA